MKKTLRALLLPSLLVGGIVTIFYTTTLANWHDYDDCRQPVTELTVQINNPIPCEGLEYGTPLKFLMTKPTIAVLKTENSKVSISSVRAGSVANISAKNLLLDW